MLALRLVAFVVAALVLVLGASAGERQVSFITWAERMVSDLHFVGGILDRRDYRERSDGFLSYQSEYYQSLHDGAAQGRMAAMMAGAEAYVRSTEDGIFRTLDPEGKGTITRSGAVERLIRIASYSDIDGNGQLDDGEAALAEAALVKGVDMTDAVQRRHLLRAMIISGGYAD